jgi:hypothetical protein
LNPSKLRSGLSASAARAVRKWASSVSSVAPRPWLGIGSGAIMGDRSGEFSTDGDASLWRRVESIPAGDSILGLGQRGRPQRLSRVGAGSLGYQAQAAVLGRWLPRNGDSHDSQLDSSKRDLCNARRRTRRLCGERFLPRLLRRRLSLWNQRLLLWRVAGMARGIVCRSTRRPLNRGGKQAEPQFRGHAAAQNRR